jgi:hypothetical protein
LRFHAIARLALILWTIDSLWKWGRLRILHWKEWLRLSKMIIILLFNILLLLSVIVLRGLNVSLNFLFGSIWTFVCLKLLELRQLAKCIARLGFNVIVIIEVIHWFVISWSQTHWLGNTDWLRIIVKFSKILFSWELEILLLPKCLDLLFNWTNRSFWMNRGFLSWHWGIISCLIMIVLFCETFH